MGIAPFASDFIPVQEFDETTFTDVEEAALGYFFDPPQEWAVIDDCGQFPCTGPKNTIFSFKNTKFDGKLDKPSFAAPKFQMIPYTNGFSEFVEGCKKQTAMNLFTC